MTTTEKPVWTRCPSCKERLFNDKIDIEVHRKHCPAELLRKIEALARRLLDLEEQVDELGRATPEATGIDLDDVAPWPADIDPPTIDEDDVDDAATFDELEQTAATSPAYYPAIDRDDDEDDAVTISPAPVA